MPHDEETSQSPELEEVSLTLGKYVTLPGIRKALRRPSFRGEASAKTNFAIANEEMADVADAYFKR